MENEIEIIFQKENMSIILDIQQPDLAKLVHEIVAKHLFVSKDNIEIRTDNTTFDKEEFVELLVDVHEEFCEEVDSFYKNITQEINTYYKDEKLSSYIIERVKGIYSDEMNENKRE